MKPVLHIITGPTAVGKTDYALTYAEEHNAEIVSCDALLVYKGMDIGTAKPSPDDLARVPHHLIDVNAVNEPYDITVYVRDARAAVEEITARGKSVVLTGGSGFYLKSFFAPVVDDIEVFDSTREQVAELYAAEGLEGLLIALRKNSPQGFGKLDTLNPRRVQRALERCMASGKSLPELLYRPRQPRQSPLWRCLHDHYAAFKSNYKQTFEQTHGFWREVVDRVVGKFLECGDLAKGFARIGACGCGKEHLLAFSCKCRNWSGSLRAQSCRRFAPGLVVASRPVLSSLRASELSELSSKEGLAFR